MNWYTADPHFWHYNILKYEARPYKDITEMNEGLINNWNKKVQKNDSIYILGDFSFGNADQTLEILNRLQGKKYLIKGNHDRVINTLEIRNKFEWVRDYFVVKENNIPIIMFHYPIQTWDRKHYGSLHFYGHVHSNISDYALVNNIPNAYNVGVDVCNFEPVCLKEILKEEVR